MNYIDIYIPSVDAEQSEIWMAELAEFPFESFQADDTALKAYIREDEYAGCRNEVTEFLRGTGMHWTETGIEYVNWNAVWESGFDPVEVDGRCVIRAPFHDAPAAGVLDIVIMPKMSFGTGHHATTWLMVNAILDMDLRGKKCLDMGSGTGVLAIAAAKLGASHADAVDIDEWAWENCRENALENGVAERITPVLGDASAIPDSGYDTIFANINRNILLADMDAYATALAPGGTLTVSGILEADTPAVRAAAEAAGLAYSGSALREGWASATFAKGA